MFPEFPGLELLEGRYVGVLPVLVSFEFDIVPISFLSHSEMFLPDFVLFGLE